MLSRVQLFVTPWTVIHQSPLSMEFSRKEYWSGLPFPTPGYLPNPGIKSASPASPALAGGFFISEPPGMLVGRSQWGLCGGDKYLTSGPSSLAECF